MESTARRRGQRQVTDEERIAKATRKGARMIGPTDCISNGDAVGLHPCAQCEEAGE